MELSCWAVVFACLALSSAFPEESKQDNVAAVAEKKQDKRGILGLGYGYENNFEHEDVLSGNDGIGFGLESGHQGLQDHGHVKHITITKKVPVPVPHPVPYTVIKKVGVPYPVKVEVPVDKPYPVHVPKPYPVPVEKPVPYTVEKKVPYPVKVPVKVPYPVPHPVPVPKPVPYIVHKPVPYPVKVPVVVKKPFPVLVKEHHHEGFGSFGSDSGFNSGDFGLHEYHH